MNLYNYQYKNTNMARYQRKNELQASLFDLVQPYDILNQDCKLEDRNDTFISIVGYTSGSRRVDCEILLGASKNELISHWNHLLGKEYNYLEFYNIGQYQENFDTMAKGIVRR
jgi:hypothetical protein